MRLQPTDPTIKKPNHYSILFSDDHKKIIKKLAKFNSMKASEVVRAVFEIYIKKEKIKI